MIFKQLKVIQAHKLERKQQLLLRLLKKIEQRKQDIKTAKEALKKHIDWRIEEENRLYEEAYEQYLNQKGIDDLRFEIGKLRSHDVVLNQRILDAENHLELAINDKNECQNQIDLAQIALEKYKVLIEKEMNKLNMVLEQEEERALDEFTSTRCSNFV